MNITFIGFSEAGPAFADVMIRGGATVTAFDLRSLDPEKAADQRAHTARVGARHSGSMAAAITNADIVISTVTVSAALSVAHEAAKHLKQNQVFCDLNSVSPETKLAIRDAIGPSGASFVEAVAMGRTAEGRLPPLLLSGQFAPALARDLGKVGVDVTVASTEWGAAPAAKLLRSVVVKGFEAVLSEALEAAEKTGAREPLLATLADWLPGVDWPDFSKYHLGRMQKHGRRRSAELRECAAFLETLEVSSGTTKGAAQRQEEMASGQNFVR
ncbi:NAD(P)-dependent oxidoreductase [Cognatiyoonia sp. IB215182]|uniref:NAD(P)-dependent oxidoreductase n=1 Tax=Cognatiyoonia sp. IB215182 TaxID=3097353 RepID=UPI002A0F5E0A|nr:DUF1932 domain-containing protein [Cognatiyoonia sp. IB215182]MDX8352444.1 NAD(P)-binding domain-containing protein [Cognatiyoonia sp. IB215182]